MADENDKPKSVTLWDNNYGWDVYADIRANGDVEICSDGTHEWYAIVPASDVEHLKSALAAMVPGNKSESVLPLLHDVFGRTPEAKNPFEEIKQFLDAHSIPWKHDFWYVDRPDWEESESTQRQSAEIEHEKGRSGFLDRLKAAIRQGKSEKNPGGRER